MKKLATLLAIGATASFANAASTLVVPFSFGPQLSDSTAYSIAVSQFDPSLGTLISVSVSATATTSGGSVTFTASDPGGAGNRTLTIASSVSIDGPVSISLNPVPSESESFTVVDGEEVSLTGNGGTDFDTQAVSAPGDDLSPYTGVGTFNFSIQGDSATASTGTATGSTEDVAPDYSVTGSVTYTYDAVIPEPSSTALLGLAGLGLILRRRK